MEAVDSRLEEAAATLGASRAWTFVAVTLPLILPGIVAGAILAFAKAMGEFGATITFVSNIPGETQTLPSAIYAFLQVLAASRQPCGWSSSRSPLRWWRSSPRNSSPAASPAGSPRDEPRRFSPASFRRVRARRGILRARRHHRAVRRSGAGKTTVVEAIAGLLQPDEGRVSADDTVLLDNRPRDRATGASPAGRLRVPGGTSVPPSHGPPEPRLRPLVRAARGRMEDMGHIVEVLGIGHLLDRRPGRLSGGEKAARRHRPGVPERAPDPADGRAAGVLDRPRKSEILPYLRRLREETRIPILYVSHSVAEIVHLATTVVR